MSSFIDELWKMVVFIGIQYTLGRRGSYPYGLLVHFSLVKITKWKEVAVVIIAALPYGGGALSGCIIAYSMKMKKRKAFFLIILGCIIGSTLFYLGFYGIIEVVNKVTR